MLFQIKLHNKDLISIQDFEEIINKLQKNFPEFEVKDMHSLNTIPNSRHFHVSSQKETGTVELTLDPELKNVITIKISKNRLTPWSIGALDEIVKFIEGL